MAKYIDKSAVVAEIDALQDATMENGHFLSSYYEGMFDGLSKIENFLNAIETKEVDLEEEISDYLTSYHLHIKDGGRVVFDNNDSPNFMCDIRHIAKHFYELGLKASKGE